MAINPRIATTAELRRYCNDCVRREEHPDPCGDCDINFELDHRERYCALFTTEQPELLPR